MSGVGGGGGGGGELGSLTCLAYGHMMGQSGDTLPLNASLKSGDALP